METTWPFFFFCNATPEIGMGHYSRCKRIASMVEILSNKMNFDSKVSINFVGIFSKEIHQEIIQQEWTHNYSQDFDCESLPRNAVAIVDSYKISNSSLNKINRHFFKTVVIDDFNRLDFTKTDLIINFRFDFDFSSYSVNKGCFGSDYFPADQSMISERIHSLKKIEKSNHDQVESVLLYLGSLSNELCQKVIDQVDKIRSGLTLFFPKGLHHDRGQLKAKNNTLNILNLQGSLSPILGLSDAVICSGGLIKYEAGFCLKPNACINQTQDQHSDTVLLERRHLTMNFGMEEDLINSNDAFLNDLETFLDPKNQRKQKIAMKNNYNTLSTQKTAQAIIDLLP